MQANCKYGTNAYTEPFKITKVNMKGMVRIKMGCITETHNIWNIKPYYD